MDRLEPTLINQIIAYNLSSHDSYYNQINKYRSVSTNLARLLDVQIIIKIHTSWYTCSSNTENTYIMLFFNDCMMNKNWTLVNLILTNYSIVSNLYAINAHVCQSYEDKDIISWLHHTMSHLEMPLSLYYIYIKQLLFSDAEVDFIHERILSHPYCHICQERNPYSTIVRLLIYAIEKETLLGLVPLKILCDIFKNYIHEDVDIDIAISYLNNKCIIQSNGEKEEVIMAIYYRNNKYLETIDDKYYRIKENKLIFNTISFLRQHY